MLSFDRAKHRYTWNGKPVPSLSDILAPIRDFSNVPHDVLEQAQVRGTAVHDAIATDFRNEPFEIDEDIAGYFEAWRKFRAEKNFRPVQIEQPLFSLEYGFACTPDFTGYVEHALSVIEWKTSFAPHPATAVQTAAQAHCAGCKHRFSLQLRADGTYRLEHHKDRQDFNVFVSLLNIYKFKEKNGLPQSH